jgi:radical SAM protein with 4Fe4S-binding SPASM domain
MKRADFDLFADKLFPYLVEVHPSNIGEPLISEWFDYLCDKAIEYGVLLDITSNGTLLNESKIRKILPNLLDIKISFDGAKKETFERIRKGASYDVVVKNVENLLRLREQGQFKGTVTLQMTVFNFNYQELPDLVRLAKNKGIDRVKAYHVHSYSEEINNYSLFHDLQRFEEVRLQTIELAEQLDIALELSEPKTKDNSTKDLISQKCRLPWAECFIDSDGAVYPCHTHNFISLGNIFIDDISSVWNSDYTVRLRKYLTGTCTDTEVICNNCGMNFLKYDENQPVPYNKSDFLYSTSVENEPVKWSKRNKQFLIKR